MREEEDGGRVVYVCECGLGFDDILIAYACEQYKRMYGVNSDDIVRRATYNPKVDQSYKRPLATP